MNVVRSRSLPQVSLIICVAIIATALTLMLPNLPREWFVVGLAAVFALALSTFVNVEKLLLFATVVFIPSIVDFRIYYNPPLEIVVNLQHITVAFLFFIWLANPHPVTDHTSRLHPIALLMIASLMWDTLTLVIAPEPLLGLSQLLVRGLGFALFFYVVHRCATVEAIERIAAYITIAILFQSFIVVLQTGLQHSVGLAFLGETSNLSYIYGSQVAIRPSGTTGHPNWLGNFLAMTLGIPMVLVYVTRKRWLRWLSIASFIAGSISLVVTLSRASWLGFLAMLMTTGVFLFLGASVEQKRRLVNFAVITLVLVCIVFAVLFPQIQARLLGNDQGSAESRLPLFTIAFNLIESHPIGGVGLANYQQMLNEFAPGTSWQGLAYVHNTFLLIMAETGIVGVSIFVLILLVIMRIAFNEARVASSYVSPYLAALLGGLVAFLIGNQFGSEYESFAIVLTLWLIFGLVLSLQKVSRQEAKSA